MTKLALFCPPFVGGTFTTAARLRAPLLERGIDLRCIGVAQDAQHQELVHEYLDNGVELWHLCADPANATRQMIRRLIQDDFPAVMCMPLEDIVTASLPLYLPQSIACVILVPMMSQAVYARARRLSGHAQRLIAVSDRVASDLIRRGNIAAGKIHTVFNGIDSSEFSIRPPRPQSRNVLRAVYLGRLSDLDKGVLLLPLILKKALSQNPAIHLDIIGEGGDASALATKLTSAPLTDRVRMLGPCPLHEVPSILSRYDCLVMPSRMEACGWSLLEAMAAGCVPVAHDIKGSIGAIIEDGVSGFVVPVGNVNRFAARMVQLSRDGELLLHMSREARVRVERRFSLTQMADGYATAVKEAMRHLAHRRPPRPIEQYTVDGVMKRTWRSHLPRPLKIMARKWMVRLGMPA